MEIEEASKNTFVETFNKAKLQKLNNLRQQNKFCDLTLKSDDGFEIKVHRVAVSSASNYFEDLLTTPMREKYQDCISLPDITGEVLEKIITFIYTSEFEEEIEEVEKITQFAVIFQLQELVEICSLALSESITDQKFLKYWRLARDNLINSFENKCLSYIVSNADQLFENSLLSDLTIEEMRSLLADERLHLQCDEKTIFEHVWKWAEGKVSETKNISEIFSEIVDLFNYAELKKEFILSRIFFNDDLTENAEPMRKIAKLTQQKCEEVASRFIFPKRTKRRLIGLAANKMFIGLREESTIEKEVDLPSNFGCTTFDNKFLICGGGGEGNDYITNSCEFFDPSTQEWKNFPSMKFQRKQHQCSNLDNKIYACGGIDRKTVEIFDLGKGEWNYGPEMLTNNWNFGLSEVNGALYAIGGQSNNVEILDPRTQKWDVVYSGFQRNHKAVCCVSIGPCIYCFTFQNVYIFDIRANKFPKEICQSSGSYLNFCELDGYIYGFGYAEYMNTYNLKRSVDLIQYDLDGKQGFKKSYGLYKNDEITYPAIVSLCY